MKEILEPRDFSHGRFRVVLLIIISLPVLIFGKDKILINYYLNKADKEEFLLDAIDYYSKALNITYRPDIIVQINEKLNEEENIDENLETLKFMLEERDLNKVASDAYVNKAEEAFEKKEYTQSAKFLKDAVLYNFDEKMFKYYEDLTKMDIYEKVFSEETILYEEDETLVEEEIQEETRDDSYFIADSSNRYLTVDELLEYNSEELGFIRNEIFARHGYIFSNEKYNDYFLNKDWYEPNPDFKASENELNSFEIKNISLIKSLE